MSQMLRKCRDAPAYKNGPENRGHSSKVLTSTAGSAKSPASETVHLLGSEAEMREVAIAQCGAGRGHQHTVDGGQQTAEQGGGWREADGSSLGHCRPLSEAQPITALRSGDNLRIPDASNNTFVCIAAFYLLQRNIASGTVH